MVSVFIPTYNGAAFLDETLNSVLGQTYSDIEVLCVDDGSTEDTVALLKRYAAKDDRVWVFEKQNEGAVPFAWNYVFPYLKGEFTLYLSQDDVLATDLIERLVEKQAENDADAVIPSVVWFEKDPLCPEEQYSALNERNRMGAMKPMTGMEAFDKMLDYAIPGFAMWRTDMIRKCGMLTESFNSDELMQRIWVSKCRTVEFSSAKFYYRQRPQSITKGLKAYHYGSLLTNMRLLEAMYENGVSAERIAPLQFSYFRSLFYLRAQYLANRKNYSSEDREKIEKILIHVYPSTSKGVQVPSGMKNLIYKFAASSEMTYRFATWMYSKTLTKQ